ncbi:MAG: hypothetical protein ABSC06_12310 [Rhodopila sp.]
MSTDSYPRSSNDTELLACRDGCFGLSKRWGDHAQVAVDGDEAIVGRLMGKNLPSQYQTFNRM